MSIQYGNQYVDEKYAPIVEPNLYTDTVLIPGVTYTDKYQIGPAGQIFVHKVAKGNAVTPVAPGHDFSHEAASDELIAIQLNNEFQKSKKIYGVQANAVDFALAEENLATAVATVRESRQYSALACMCHEGTFMSSTSAIATADAAETMLLDMRKTIKDNHGKANFALVNTTVYKLLLNKIGVVINEDPATISAEMMKRFGLTIMECNSFDTATAKYYNYSGTLKTVDLTDVEMVVGYSEAFSVVDNLNAIRVHDSENFIGSLAQVDINTGFRVTNSAMIVVKATAASV